jgi:hypothetical protein
MRREDVTGDSETRSLPKKINHVARIKVSSKVGTLFVALDTKE